MILGHKFRWGWLGNIFSKPIGSDNVTDYCVRCGAERN